MCCFINYNETKPARRSCRLAQCSATARVTPPALSSRERFTSQLDTQNPHMEFRKHTPSPTHTAALTYECLPWHTRTSTSRAKESASRANHMVASGRAHHTTWLQRDRLIERWHQRSKALNVRHISVCMSWLSCVSLGACCACVHLHVPPLRAMPSGR
jgi:hypothetical protein